MANDRIIDAIDRHILNILQSDARASNTDVAKRVGLAPSAVLERVRKLEERGLIQGYAARVNPKPMGHGLLAFVFVKSEESDESHTARRLAEIPEVQEVHNIAGEDCYLVKVRVADPESLARLLRDKVGAIKAVRSTRTTIVLETLKESTSIPIAPGDDSARVAGKARKGGKR